MPEDLSVEACPTLAVPLERVRELFARYGLLDDRVRFLPGWFADTLPRAPIERLALLRIDADLYESTGDALAALYDKVSSGGFVIVDDYGCIPACRTAVDEFRAARGIQEPLEIIDWTGVFWRREASL
jgi:O-methyltransferase